jgi:hypothetical protein
VSTTSRTTAEILLSVDAHLDGIRKAQDSLAKTRLEAQATESAFGKFGTALTAGAIIGTLATIGGYFSRIADEAGKLVDAADALGVSLQDLQAIQIVGSEFGIGAESINAVLEKIGINLGKAGAGSDATRAAFARLGLSVETMMTLNPAERYEAIARAYTAATDKAQALASVQEILGRQGPKQAAYLQLVSTEGLSGLKAQTELLRANEEAARQVDDAWDTAGRVWQFVKAQSTNFLGAMIKANSGPMAYGPNGMPNPMYGQQVEQWEARLKAEADAQKAKIDSVTKAPAVAATDEQIRASLALYGPYVKAHKDYSDALALVSTAAETAGQKVARLNAEADKLEADAAAKQANIRDLPAMAEGEAMRAEAQKKRNEASKIDTEEYRKRVALTKQQHEQDLAEVAVTEQITERKTQLADVDEQLMALDKKGLDYMDRWLVLETERLRIRKELATLEKTKAAQDAQRATRSAQDALNAAKLGVSRVEADPFLTSKQRDAALLPALKAEIETIKAQIIRLKTEADAQADEAAKQTLLGEVRTMEGQLNTAETRVGAVAGGSTLGGEIGIQMARLQDGFTSVADTITNTIGAAIDGVASSIEGLINGTMTWSGALWNIGTSIVNEVVASFARMAAQWVIQHTIMAAVSRVFHLQDVAGTVAAETTKTGVTVAGAQARNTATIGEAGKNLVLAGIKGMSAVASIPYVGPILAIAALAAIVAAGAKLMGGFADGGYTGSGGKYQPAGIVHAGEVVFSQADVARWGGVDAVENLRLSGASGVGVSGVVAGSGASASGGAQRIILVDDRDTAAKLAEDPEFNSHVVEVNRRNRYRYA